MEIAPVIKNYVKNSPRMRQIAFLILHMRRILRPTLWPAYTGFLRDFFRFKKMSKGSSRFTVSLLDQYPRLEDNTSDTPFDRHYVYHCAWAACILKETKPALHVDIGSSLNFCSMVSAFIPMEFHDVRPPDLELENLSVKVNTLGRLDIPDHSVVSLSCMHVLEHLGLGRYGDPLDPQADLTGIAELKRILAPGGNLLIVVPLGTPKVMFNGQRVYSYGLIKYYFGELELREFAFIPDSAADGHLIRNPTPDQMASFRSGCGCFWFKEKMI
jgi:hypothetical protein